MFNYNQMMDNFTEDIAANLTCEELQVEFGSPYLYQPM